MAGPIDQRDTGLVAPETALGQSGLAFLRDLIAGTHPAPPFSAAAGIWPVSVEEGLVVFEGAPSERFYNPLGTVHGGWIAMVLDSVMGCAVHSVLKAGQTYTTIEMKTVFVKAIVEATGTLTCEGRLLHVGSRIASSEGKLFDSRGRLLAHGTETCLIMEPRAPRA